MNWHSPAGAPKPLFVVLEEQGSPRRAGKRLGIHENTVAKRLRAIDALLESGERAGPADLLAALTIQLAGQGPPPAAAQAATAALSEYVSPRSALSTSEAGGSKRSP